MENKLVTIIKAMLASQSPRIEDSLGVPLLVGMTQAGKTTLLKRIGNEEYDQTLVMNVQNTLPEESAGLPKAVEVADGEVWATYSQPTAIPVKMWRKILAGASTLLILDEVDKPSRETLNSYLSLVAERRLGQHQLPPNVHIAGAMNEPVIPLPPEWLARWALLPYPAGPASQLLNQRDDLRRIKWLLRGIYDSVGVTFPARVATLGAAHKLARWIGQPEYCQDPDIRQLVTQSLYPAEQSSVILSRWADRPIALGPEWAKAVQADDLLDTILDVLHNTTDVAEAQEINNILDKRANEDKTGEFLRAYQVFLNTAIGPKSIGRPELHDQAREELAKAAREYATTEQRKATEGKAKRKAKA